MDALIPGMLDVCDPDLSSMIELPAPPELNINTFCRATPEDDVTKENVRPAGMESGNMTPMFMLDGSYEQDQEKRIDGPPAVSAGSDNLIKNNDCNKVNPLNLEGKNVAYEECREASTDETSFHSASGEDFPVEMVDIDENEKPAEVDAIEEAAALLKVEEEAALGEFQDEAVEKDGMSVEGMVPPEEENDDVPEINEDDLGIKIEEDVNESPRKNRSTNLGNIYLKANKRNLRGHTKSYSESVESTDEMDDVRSSRSSRTSLPSITRVCCLKCGDKFKDGPSLRAHFRVKHPKFTEDAISMCGKIMQYIDCPDCKDRFQVKSAFLMHAFKIHSHSKYLFDKVDVYDAELLSDFLKTLKVTVKSEPKDASPPKSSPAKADRAQMHTCTFCTNAYNRRGNLYKHIMSKHRKTFKEIRQFAKAEPDTESEADPESEPEDVPEQSDSESEPVLKPEPVPEPEPVRKPAPKLSTKPAPKLSPKLSPKSVPKLSPKRSPKPAPKLSPKRSPKLSPKPSPQPSRTSVAPRPKPRPKSKQVPQARKPSPAKSVSPRPVQSEPVPVPVTVPVLPKSFNCEWCRDRMKTMDQLNKHLKSKHLMPENVNSDGFFLPEFYTALELHFDVYEKEENCYECVSCKETFFEKVGLLEHFSGEHLKSRVENMQIRLECSICSHKEIDVGKLIDHMWNEHANQRLEEVVMRVRDVRIGHRCGTECRFLWNKPVMSVDAAPREAAAVAQKRPTRVTLEPPQLEKRRRVEKTPEVDAMDCDNDGVDDERSEVDKLKEQNSRNLKNREELSRLTNQQKEEERRRKKEDYYQRIKAQKVPEKAKSTSPSNSKQRCLVCNVLCADIQKHTKEEHGEKRSPRKSSRTLQSNVRLMETASSPATNSRARSQPSKPSAVPSPKSKSPEAIARCRNCRASFPDVVSMMHHQYYCTGRDGSLPKAPAEPEVKVPKNGQFVLMDQEPAFKCTTCKLSYETVSEWQAHIQENHLDELNCELCNTPFQDELRLAKHLNMAHNVGYPCVPCGSSFSNKKVFLRHVSLEHKMNQNWFNGISLADVDQIIKIFGDHGFNNATQRCAPAEAGGALKDESRGILYQCEFCNECFTSRLEVNDHIMYAHETN
ncbi:uncharacterized protein LOC135942912 isoform X2 [Cloeon dipterum]|uniref:uncharacterized protein LOC135942912 isoform X2 n=1 Tax=Cloeon dipterum TaxID=197152 RepID=UPI0032200ECB